MKRIIAGIMTILLIFSVCGCKDDENISNQNKNETSSTKNISGEMALYSYRPDTLCPILSKNEANINMLGVVYESLIKLSDDLYPQECLAESWSVSEDGKRWTFILRPDVFWHNGDKLGASDVIYTVNQIRESEDSIYRYNVSNIKSIKPSGENGIEIEVEKPWANFVNMLYFPIIKKGSDEIDAKHFKPVGTGPYKFEDKNEGNMFYLVRNDSWWGETPVTERITVKLLPDSGTALYTFSSGGIDMAPTDDMNWGRFADPASSSFVSVPTPVFHFVGINHENEVLGFKEIRQAISKAIDRTKIIDETMTGYAQAATMPVHQKWFVCGETRFDFTKNIEDATKLLEKNKWTKSGRVYSKTVEEDTYKTSFNLIINEENAQREMIASFVKTDLAELGFFVEVEKLPFDEYKERISEGDYDMFIGSYVISPDLDFSFILKNDNMFRFKNEKLSSTISSLGKRYSIPEIEAGYAEVIKCFDEFNPVIGLFFEDRIMLYNNRIKGDIVPSYFDIYEGIEALRKESAE